MNAPLLTHVLAVAIGGAIGSVSRFVSGHYFGMWFGTTFPWATLFVNVVGSAWLGYIGTVAMAKPGSIDPIMRLFLTTGFSGGFTTFSTFAFETIVLYQKGDTTIALANVGGNLFLGIAAAFLGIVLARMS